MEGGSEVWGLWVVGVVGVVCGLRLRLDGWSRLEGCWVGGGGLVLLVPPFSSSSLLSLSRCSCSLLFVLYSSFPSFFPCRPPVSHPNNLVAPSCSGIADGVPPVPLAYLFASLIASP